VQHDTWVEESELVVGLRFVTAFKLDPQEKRREKARNGREVVFLFGGAKKSGRENLISSHGVVDGELPGFGVAVCDGDGKEGRRKGEAPNLNDL